MNARLFKALDALTEVTGTIVTAINWPVNEDFEVLRGEGKDADVREYVKTFLELYGDQPYMGRLNDGLSQSAIHIRMAQERDRFVRSSIRNPSQYDSPPGSVSILTLLNSCIATDRLMTSSGFTLSWWSTNWDAKGFAQTLTLGRL